MRIFWYVSSPLFEQAGDGAGSGGGAGADGGAGNDGAAGGAGTDDKSGDKKDFNPTAFKAEIMGEVNKSINGAVKASNKEIEKMFQKFALPTHAGGAGDNAADGAGNNAGAAGNAGTGDAAAGNNALKIDPATAVELRNLKRQNEELQRQWTDMKAEANQTRAQAEEKERHATVQAHLASKYKFYDQTAFEDALVVFRSQIKRNEDGKLTGPDGTPMEPFIEESMRTKQYLLAPKDAGAAGARQGSGRSGARQYSLDDLDLDKFRALKSDEQAALRKQVSDAALASMSGKG